MAASPSLHSELAQHPLAAPLRAALVTHRDLVLQAPTGSGKSTAVPLLLLPEPWLAGRKIIMLEPRRLAARAVAQRMAALLGENVGETVGYRMRMDTRVGARTRLEVVTEGVLTRLLQADPALEGVGLVIFDEYHERSLQADMALALALDARAQLDAQFRLLVMSATLDGGRVAALLDGASVVDVPGRSFPVDVEFIGSGLPLLPAPARPWDTGELVSALAAAVRRALREHAGDTLVFLPGFGEIRRLQEALGATPLGNDVQLLPLYGELGAREQDAVLQPGARGMRRIVLATNVAETSITIPGITVVIDSGLVRRSRFDPNTGMRRLELERISRASAEQRAGRAGRTAPGVALRLWSEGAHAALAADTPAEIVNADLAPLALELARWGAHDAAALRWLDPPPAATLAQARELLRQLGALDTAGRITAAGKTLAALPVHPRLGHLLQRAAGSASLAEAAQLAALLSERDLLRGSLAERDPDIRTRLELLARSVGGDASVRRIRAQAGQLAAHPLLQRAAVAAGSDGASPGAAPPGAAPESTGALLALAFPDRVGQRREGAGGRYLLRNGRGAVFAAPCALAQAEFIVAIELDDREREARIALAAPLTRVEIEALFGEDISTQELVQWDTRSEAVEARRLRTLGALTLGEQALTDAAPERIMAGMLQGVRALGLEALPWEREARELQARAEFVRHLPANAGAGSDWPASDAATLLATLEQWLTPWLQGVTRRGHLARAPLIEALRARFTRAQLQLLERLAPATLTVPSGSRIRIAYDEEGGPAVSVRLQECFGLAESPRIGNGSVPVTFKLLSPAQRPVQITRDLKGFWASSYFAVRKDLRGRYPRHHWPENPLEAAATRRAKPRCT